MVKIIRKRNPSCVKILWDLPNEIYKILKHVCQYMYQNQKINVSKINTIINDKIFIDKVVFIYQQINKRYEIMLNNDNFEDLKTYDPSNNCCGYMYKIYDNSYIKFCDKYHHKHNIAKQKSKHEFMNKQDSLNKFIMKQKLIHQKYTEFVNELYLNIIKITKEHI